MLRCDERLMSGESYYESRSAFAYHLASRAGYAVDVSELRPTTIEAINLTLKVLLAKGNTGATHLEEAYNQGLANLRKEIEYES